MQYALLYAVMMLAGVVGWAQNLVPNPSFEQYDKCPSKYGDIQRAVPWLSLRGTPDLLAACTQNKSIKTPGNYFGSMVPRTGGNYAGLASYHPTVPNELIAVKLIRPLRAGRRYRAGFWLSLAYGYSGYASNNMGLRFSNTPYTDTLASEAHLRMDDILDYTGDWVLFEGVFQADQDYHYLIIGNFYDKAHSKLKERPFASTSSAYYYIDDVFVEELDAAPEVPLTVRLAEGLDQPATLYLTPEAQQEKVYTFLRQVELPLEPSKSYRLRVEVEGHYPFMEEIRAEQPQLLMVEPQPLQQGATIVLRHIYFDFNQYSLRPESQAELEILLKILQKHPRMRILIAGHTDNIGTSEYNRFLSMRRAEAVRQYLIEKGIAAERLQAEGFGMDKPIASNNTEEGRALNRRVEFTILGL